eukprot:2001586-Prymnesium_polylepis.1
MGNVPRVTRAANGDAGRQNANILSPAAAPCRQIVRRREAVKIVVHLIHPSIHGRQRNTGIEIRDNVTTFDT